MLLPAPGYFAAKLQTVQRKKMTVVSHIFYTFHLPFYFIHGNRLTIGFKLFRRVSTTLWRQYGISSEEFLIALGVLRMVKLFGWEHKMSESIKQKREEELVWIWKDKVK